ncbi:MAG: hypothetical protein RIK87_13510 [Fuerstiella sp.]
MPPELPQPHFSRPKPQSARPLLRTIWAVLTLLAVAAVVAISGHLFYTETSGTYDPESHTVLVNGNRIGALTYLILYCGIRATVWCGAPWLLTTVALGAFYAAARPER